MAPERCFLFNSWNRLRIETWNTKYCFVLVSAIDISLPGWNVTIPFLIGVVEEPHEASGSAYVLGWFAISG